MMARGSPHCPVLIVEDDEDLREMMAQLLTLEGFQAAAVANGREALDYLHQSDKPDVILLDLMMPVMDGWQFRHAQLEDPQISRIPVVVLSAMTNLRSRGDELHAAECLAKPVDVDYLLEAVSRYS